MSVHNNALLNNTGIPDLKDAKIVLIHTQWNDIIVNELVNGCRKTLSAYGISDPADFEVPGAFELPFACRRYFEATQNTHKEPEALIAFGTIIRGETPHFDYVCRAVTDGVTQLNLRLPIPVIFGVLTVNDIEQAQQRIGGTQGHKGTEAALTALKMIAFNRKLK